MTQKDQQAWRLQQPALGNVECEQNGEKENDGNSLGVSRSEKS
jgi:hypothetical protein